MNESPFSFGVTRGLRGWVGLTLLACCAALAPAQTTQTATQPVQPLPPTLLAFGTAQRYWIANVDSYRDGAKVRFKTLVRAQALPAGDWKDLGVVFGHAMGLAESQGELAVLLDDWSWKRLGGSGLTTGPAVPGAGPVFAWGSVGGVLHAVRAVEGGAAAVTPRSPDAAPATRAATNPKPATAAATRAIMTTRPATTVASREPASRPTTQVALLRFNKGQWEGLADLPPGAAGEPVSLGGAGAKPLIAMPGANGAIRTYALVDSTWQDFGQVRPGSTVGSFGVLSISNFAALWVGDTDGKLKLFLKREGEDWAPATKFTLPPEASSGAQRALAAAGEEFRLAVVQDGNFKEQRYDPSGAPRGSLTPMPVPQTYKPDPFFKALQIFVILGMVVVLLVTVYKRRAASVPKDEE